MALNNLGLGFVFTAKDLASGTMRTLKGKLNGLGAQSKATGIAMKAGFAIAASGIVPLVLGLASLSAAMALAGAAGKFEEGLAAVGAVTRATTAELEALRNTAIKAGIETQFSPTEAIEGLTSLATAGQTASQATKALGPVLDLAAGSLGQLGVAGAAEAVVGTLNSYSQTADKAAETTDKLLRITQISNFQTRDFATGLSKAAAAGAVFNQDLDEVLITMGLMRNANIDASSASTAFRESTRRLGSDQGAQAAIQKAGVKIFDDQTGRMRSLIDISQDLAEKTKDMTDKERNRLIVQGFGARGLLAFNAISKATTTVMRDGVEVTLRNADAIEFLRGEMKTATGTAEAFRQKMLDTFEGQKKLLTGTLQTLAVVFGEPFAKVFKPFVNVLVTALNVVLQVVNDMPSGVKTMAAAFVIGGGVILTFAGIIGILTGLVIVLLPFMLLLGKILLVITLATLPFIVAMAAVVAGVVAVVFAIRNNLGGLGDAFRNTLKRATLVWDALKQLFTQGGFSGAVRDELNKTENQGLKRFVINLFRIGKRIEEFLSGFKAGFLSTIEVLDPVFKDLRLAFLELGKAFGFVSDEAGTLAGQNMDDFAVNGIILGEIMGNVLASIARGFASVIRGIAQFVNTMSIARVLMIIASKQIEVSFANMADNIVISILRAVAAAAKIAAMVPAPLRTSALQGLVDVGDTAATEADVRQRRVNRRQTAVASGPEAGQLLSLRAVEARARVESAALDTGPAQAGGANAAAILQELRADRTARKQELLDMLKRPVQVTLALDGVKVGEGVANAGRGEQDAAFIPGTAADVT